MSTTEKKIEILIQVRAKYNESLLKIKSEKRRSLIQKWANDINLKILKLEDTSNEVVKL